MTNKKELLLRPFLEKIPNHVNTIAKTTTGFDLKDPQIVDKIINDHEEIIKKYNLPNIELMFSNPEKFSEQLDNSLKEVHILKGSETKKHFDKNPLVYASYFFNKKAIGVNYKKLKESNNRNLFSICLIHELTHSHQDKLEPQMDILTMEYEAYVASSQIIFFKEPHQRNFLFKEEIEKFFTQIYLSVKLQKNQNQILLT